MKLTVLFTKFVSYLMKYSIGVILACYFELNFVPIEPKNNKRQNENYIPVTQLLKLEILVRQ